MTLRTRLTLSTIVGLLLLTGLSLSFYLMLPGLADELLRREAETRLDEAGREFAKALRALGDPPRQSLSRLADDEELLAVGRELREGHVTNPWDLARDLCARYGLSSLLLLDASGRLLSLHPDAARVGMSDPAALALAHAALQGPAFVEGEAPAGDVPARLALAELFEDGRILALTFHPLRRTDIEHVATRFGAHVHEVSGGAQPPPGDPDTRTVHLVGPQAQRVFSVVLKGEENRGLVIQRLLVRGVLLLSLPWLLGGAFLLVWIGWPKREKAK